jgi:hypothetical protein
MEELLRQEEAEKIAKESQEKYDLSKVEEMIKDNEIKFEHKEKVYRVRLMNLREKEELDELRRKKYGKLIQDRDILLEKDLIKIYEERGVDITGLDEEVKKINSELFNIQIQLGEALSKDESETILKAYKEKIDRLTQEKNVIIIQKTQLLGFSLENQLLNYVSEVITYLTVDILSEDKWVRLFKNYDEFMDYKDEELINKAAIKSMIIQYTL